MAAGKAKTVVGWLCGGVMAAVAGVALAGGGDGGMRAAIAPVVHLTPVALQTAPSTTTAPAATTDDIAKQQAEDAKLLEQAKAKGFSFAAAPGSSRGKDEIDRFIETSSCTACHTGYNGQYEHTMHKSAAVKINCTDCHGGDASVSVPRDITKTDSMYLGLKNKAHPTPKMPELWKTSANPEIPGADTLKESADYIRFVNPGDNNAAMVACYNCHTKETERVPSNMMSHGAMLWGAALYNNGTVPRKNAIYGESYGPDGQPRALLATTWPSSPNGPTYKDFMNKGHVPVLYPLPRWNITQTGNVLRVFERGGKSRPILGEPHIESDPGKPEVKLTIRGRGTDVSTDPVFLGLQKTRLLDPTLTTFGTNDHPGDYRASGCSACHVVYANDRSPVHSGKWAKYGNMGKSINPDPTVDKEESGHPIAHQFQRSVPSSSCMVCHVHPGTNVVNSYFGFMWWDNEVDGQHMYPSKQKKPSEDDDFNVSQHNPEGSAPRGLWSNMYPADKSQTGKVAGDNFLANLIDLNPELKHTQFADFHGHGWVFRAVYKQDRKGNLLDTNGNIVPEVTAAKLGAAVSYASTKPSLPPAGNPVHLKDIHLEKGMSCVDCHFAQDMHGDGNLYVETRAAVMESCIDCHGTADKPAVIMQYLKGKRSLSKAELDKLLLNAFTGSAARNGMSDKEIIERNSSIISKHWDFRGGKLFQLAAEDLADTKRGWNTVQTTDTIRPDSWWATAKPEAGVHDKSANLARYAHTIRKDGKTWGSVPTGKVSADLELAHNPDKMSCYACHTSWTTACFGCHLPMQANKRKTNLHNEGELARNYTSYNYQTLRDDVYMLGIDSTVKGNQIVPIRSSCAVMVSSKDANRNWLYAQQQTVSTEGFAGTAFSSYFPHTVRSVETKQCTDCHVSKENDNNAVMAQLLLQGTNSVNFIGRFAYVAEGEEGFQAVAVTERSEPQAVFGSRLHEMAYPDDYQKHLEKKMRLQEAYGHEGEVLDLQFRDEYLYAACGKDGLRVFDIANVDNKGFSERITSAPVSPLGQRFYVKTKYATSVTSPSTMALDPTRPHFKENQEQNVHLFYAFLYVTDKYEGLVVVGNTGEEAKKNNAGVATLLDGDPDNNFLSRAATFNPANKLAGARSMAVYGTKGYICCDAGVAVVDLDNPAEPKLLAMVPMTGARRIGFQFRYGFVATESGLQVLDVTDAANPKVVPGAALAIPDCRDVYISRTYAYVAAGKGGLAIIDVEKPEHPVLEQQFTAGGALVDTTAVRIGMTNASMFAYVADGVGGLKVIQLTSPDDTPTWGGFSPKTAPRLIATYPTKGPAISLNEGLDRDRAVDESGNQLAVFGRRGARPFNLEEQQRLYLKAQPDGTKVPYYVTNTPDPTVVPLVQPAEKEEKPAETKSAAPGKRVPGRR